MLWRYAAGGGAGLAALLGGAMLWRSPSTPASAGLPPRPAVTGQAVVTTGLSASMSWRAAVRMLSGARHCVGPRAGTAVKRSPAFFSSVAHAAGSRPSAAILRPVNTPGGWSSRSGVHGRSCGAGRNKIGRAHV